MLLQFKIQSLKLLRFLGGGMCGAASLLDDLVRMDQAEYGLLCLSGAEGGDAETVERLNTVSSPGILAKVSNMFSTGISYEL